MFVSFFATAWFLQQYSFIPILDCCLVGLLAKSARMLGLVACCVDSMDKLGLALTEVEMDWWFEKRDSVTLLLLFEFPLMVELLSIVLDSVEMGALLLVSWLLGLLNYCGSLRPFPIKLRQVFGYPCFVHLIARNQGWIWCLCPIVIHQNRYHSWIPWVKFVVVGVWFNWIFAI